jgi:hypothetical protein
MSRKIAAVHAAAGHPILYYRTERVKAEKDCAPFSLETLEDYIDSPEEATQQYFEVQDSLTRNALKGFSHSTVSLSELDSVFREQNHGVGTPLNLLDAPAAFDIEVKFPLGRHIYKDCLLRDVDRAAPRYAACGESSIERVEALRWVVVGTPSAYSGPHCDPHAWRTLVTVQSGLQLWLVNVPKCHVSERASRPDVCPVPPSSTHRRMPKIH